MKEDRARIGEHAAGEARDAHCVEAVTTFAALLGTPESAVERVLEYRAAGADMVNIALRAPVDRDVIEAYLEHTVPAVRAATR